jgi:hypothetical protein
MAKSSGRNLKGLVPILSRSVRKGGNGEPGHQTEFDFRSDGIMPGAPR